MPKKGETLPYKVSFQYPDQPKATRPFARPEDAEALAQDIARRGGNASVVKVVEESTCRISDHPAWTERDHELAELIEQVRDLADFEDPRAAGHRLADELTRISGLRGRKF